MKVKANNSFVGAVCMAAGEIRDIPDGDALQDLLSCGYVSPLQEKVGKPSESKRSDTGNRKG